MRPSCIALLRAMRRAGRVHDRRAARTRDGNPGRPRRTVRPRPARRHPREHLRAVQPAAVTQLDGDHHLDGKHAAADPRLARDCRGPDRRVITCSSYANRHTVYSAATFCPVCGLRPTTDIVLELIQPHGTCWQRKTGSKRTSARALRAGGVFERLVRASPRLRGAAVDDPRLGDAVRWRARRTVATLARRPRGWRPALRVVSGAHRGRGLGGDEAGRHRDLPRRLPPSCCATVLYGEP